MPSLETPSYRRVAVLPLVVARCWAPQDCVVSLIFLSVGALVPVNDKEKELREAGHWPMPVSPVLTGRAGI